MPPTLNDLITLASQAGLILRQSFGLRLQVDHKGVIDLVSEADRLSEKFLLDYIRSRFPGDRIVAEESGELAGTADRVWYIDPLDGTVNYVHGIPIYSVSIAYTEASRLRIGVVYDPSRRMLQCRVRSRRLAERSAYPPFHHFRPRPRPARHGIPL